MGRRPKKGIISESDLFQEVKSFLQENGLVVKDEDLVMDGNLHRCGTESKPTSQNGAFIVHPDQPASAWCMDWSKDDTGGVTWSMKSESEITPQERKAWKDRVKEDKEKREADRKARWDEAAQKATQIYNKLADATNENAYLKRKGVHAVPGLKQGDNGTLVMPVMDRNGCVVSLQFIAENGSKKFLTGGWKSGCRFPIRPRESVADETLYLAEGLATGLSVHEATGCEVWVTLDAGNIKPVAELAREKYQSRSIIIAADNDCTDKEGKPRTDGNPGRNKAKEAAESIGAEVSLCPAIEHRSTDFNDLHTKCGLNAVREALRKTLENIHHVPHGFRISDTGPNQGLYRTVTTRSGEIQEIRIGNVLNVLGLTRTSNGNDWGALLEWSDLDERVHRFAMPHEMLFLKDNTWTRILTSGGYRLEYNCEKYLAEFLTKVAPPKRITCVDKTGWHGSSYVLPQESIKMNDSEEIVFQGINYDTHSQVGGTFEGWREAAELSVGNTRMVFSLSASLAGMLIMPAGMESGGFILFGGSSCGKTTGLELGSSVYGSPKDKMRNWRATSNGIESLAALSNDSVLALDEIGQAGPTALSEALYMVANGGGKVRANREGNARAQTTWRTMLLSTGEINISTKLSEGGIKAKAGQEVRLSAIPCGKEHIVNLHGHEDSAALVNRIKEIVYSNYGHAVRKFVQWFISHRKDLYFDIRSSVDATARELCGNNVDSQVMRVAQRFALCSVAGAIALSADILPATMDIRGSVKACFNDWLAERGDGELEDKKILEDVRHFIEQHGASRFQNTNAIDDKCINRVGFVRHAEAGNTYYVFPESFKQDVLKGHDFKRAIRVLEANGWLIPDGKGKPSKVQNFHGDRIRCYEVVVPSE